MQNLSIKQILQALAVIVLMIVIAWLAFYLLIVVLVIGGIGACIMFVRRFLMEKGIIKSPVAQQPHTANSETPSSTVIETEYEDVTSEQAPKD